jgi:hypothetical protein
MDVKRFSSIVCLILISALFLTTTQINGQSHCTAAVVWSDNFEDGDISDWTLAIGAFSVADGTLRGTDSANAISHASTTAYGTWTFDIEIVDFSSVYVNILAGEISGGGISTSCYCLRINQFDMELLESTNYQNTQLDSYDPAESLEGWLNIEIVREATGQFAISVNGTQQMAATDTTHSASTYFVFYCNDDCAIDNIEIDESAGTSPPPNGPGTSTPPGIPGFPLAAIGLGLLIPIALVLVTRSRSTDKTE